MQIDVQEVISGDKDTDVQVLRVDTKDIQSMSGTSRIQMNTEIEEERCCFSRGTVNQIYVNTRYGRWLLEARN